MKKNTLKSAIGAKLIPSCMLAAIVLCFSGCSKDEKLQSLEVPELTQTIWKGNVTVNENNMRFQSNISVEFRTETTGYFILSEISGDNKDTYALASTFSFKPVGKTLYIHEGFKNILLGDWWTIKNDNKELIMVRELSNPKYADTLKITKIY